VNLNLLSRGWFATYGTKILAGRDFDGRDVPGGSPVAIVNQAFAKKYFGGANPIGRMIRQRAGPDKPQPAREIIGLVEDAVYRSLREPLTATFYLPAEQWQEGNMPSGFSLSVRTAGPRPATLAKNVAKAIATVDGDLSISFLPLADQVDSSLAQERLTAMLAGFFGGLALLLAAVGLYGVTAYSVGRRRTEIGIRMALGARPAAVVRMVLGRVALLVGLGVLIGTVVSLWAAQLVDKLLFGLQPRDPLTLALAVAVLGGIGCLAAWFPARRASRIGPADVLREG
jgi:putative ABC transport system permease protein